MPQLEEVLPKYLQIAQSIREQILSGELEPGDEVPSERQIVAEWGVSRPTATRALSALRSEGLVEARQGSGTFVRAQPRFNRRARDRYARSRQAGKIYPSDERAEIVSAGVEEAPDEVRKALDLANGARAIRRRRVIYNEDEPVEVSTSWFDAELAESAPRLLETERIREGTLAYLERVKDRRGESAEDWISARLASEEERNALDLDDAAAVLVVRHRVLDEKGQPLEFVEACYPPGRWTFQQTYALPG